MKTIKKPSVVCVQTLTCFLFLLFVLGIGTGCSAIPKSVGCKIQAWNNANVSDHLRQRYDSFQLVRAAIIPFEVPETFAPGGTNSVHFGKDLALRFRDALVKTGEIPIVELFNLDRWPGKREEFFAGNYQAIAYARNAGYDLVIVGYLKAIRNREDMTIVTKIIDANDSVTIWDGETTVTVGGERWEKLIADSPLSRARPEDFSFFEKTNEYATCTVDNIFPPIVQKEKMRDNQE